MSSREKPRQNIPGYHVYESVPGMLTAMYQGPDVVAYAQQGRILHACGTDPDRLVAAVARGQYEGRLP